MKFSSSVLASPLFSQPYELLSPPARRSLGEQALCSDNHLNRPGVCCGGSPRFYLATRHPPLVYPERCLRRAISLAFSIACSLFGAPKKVNSFAIKQIQPLFPKHPGWGGYPPCLSRHSPFATRHLPSSAPSAPLYPEPRRVRYTPWTFPINPSTSQGASLFRLSTVDCRLPSHNAKIHSNSL